MVTDKRSNSWVLVLRDVKRDLSHDAHVVTDRSGESCSVVVSTNEVRFDASGYDVEEALLLLRVDLERAGFLLLCNRFRRNAVVSSMCRQMTGGLGCYLVRPFRGVEPERVAQSLEPAPLSAVGTIRESEEYIIKWKRGVDLLWHFRWIKRLSLRWNRF